jgi:hypothetical protein
VHDLGGPDFPGFRTVQHNDDLIQGTDPGVDISRFDTGNHGLADACPFGKFRLFQSERFPARAEFIGCGDMHPDY